MTQSGLSERSVQVELYPDGQFYWTAQQELQTSRQDPSSYDLVVLPCLPPSESDPAVEKFVLEHANVPVVLVRPGSSPL